MKIISISWLLALLWASIQPITGQNITLQDVRSIKRLRPFFTPHTHEVSGYYCFFETAKAGNGKRGYQLNLLDKDLQLLTVTEMIDDKNVNLISGANTGKSLLLLFENQKAKTYTFRQFSDKGVLTNKREFVPTRVNPAFNKRPGQFLTGLPDKGFLHYLLAPNMYSIAFYPEDSTLTKDWTIVKPIKADFFEAGFLAANDSLLLSTFTIFSDEMRKDGQFSVLGIALKSGKQLFETPVEDEQYALQITNGFVNDGYLYLFGLYFNKTDEVFAANNLGFCAIKMDLAGKIISRQYISREKEVNKFLPVDENKKPVDIGHLFFHDFIRTRDGKIFGIAESFRRNASASGILSTVLTGSGNLTKTVIENFYIFELTPDFKLNSVQIVLKTSKNLELSTEFNRPQATAKYINAIGGFDYAFLQTSHDYASFTVCYLNADNNSSDVLGSIQYSNQSVVTNKKNIAHFSGALPAKPGYALLYKFGKNTVELQLESY